MTRAHAAVASAATAGILATIAANWPFLTSFYATYGVAAMLRVMGGGGI